MHPSFKTTKFILLSLLLIMSILISQNGNIKTITDRATKEYQNGDYSAAIKYLEIMKQKQGKELNSLPPQTYRKSNGFVTATLILEAPMIKEVRSTLNSPQSAQNIDDGIIESTSYKKTFVRYQDADSQG